MCYDMALCIDNFYLNMAIQCNTLQVVYSHGYAAVTYHATAVRFCGM